MSKHTKSIIEEGMDAAAAPRRPAAHPDPMGDTVGGDTLREGAAKAKQAKGKTEPLPAVPVENSFREDQRNRVYNIYEPTNETLNIDDIDSKGQMSDRELKYISLHLTFGVDPITALELAGYKKYSDQHAYFLGREIQKKYESRAGAVDLFINLNYGPAEIARSIIDIAVNCPNAQVRLNAIALAAKAVGMLQEALAQQPGVTIIIKGRDTEQHAQPGGREPAKIHKEQAVPGPVALIK